MRGLTTVRTQSHARVHTLAQVLIFGLGTRILVGVLLPGANDNSKTPLACMCKHTVLTSL